MNDAGVRLLYDISEQVSLGVFQSVKGAHVVKRMIKRIERGHGEEEPSLGCADRLTRLWLQTPGDCPD
jgi:hypothetical protein